jgi:hypothetical protein
MNFIFNLIYKIKLYFRRNKPTDDSILATIYHCEFQEGGYYELPVIIEREGKTIFEKDKDGVFRLQFMPLDKDLQ